MNRNIPGWLQVILLIVAVALLANSCNLPVLNIDPPAQATYTALPPQATYTVLPTYTPLATFTNPAPTSTSIVVQPSLTPVAPATLVPTTVGPVNDSVDSLPTEEPANCPNKVWQPSGKGSFNKGTGALAFECVESAAILRPYLPTDGQGSLTYVQPYHSGYNGPEIFHQTERVPYLDNETALAMMFVAPEYLDSGSFWRETTEAPKDAEIEAVQIQTVGNKCQKGYEVAFESIDSISLLESYLDCPSGSWVGVQLWNSKNNDVNPMMAKSGLSKAQALDMLLVDPTYYNSGSFRYAP